MSVPVTLGRQVRTLRAGPAVLTETSHLPDTCLDRHAHEHACFTYVADGWFIEDFGRTRHRCRAGTVLYKPAGAAHANRYGAEGARSFIVEITDPAAGDGGGPPVPGGALSGGVRHFPGGRIAELARRALAELRLMDAAAPLIIDGLVRQMVGHAARAASIPAEREPPPWLRTVRDRLRDDLAGCPAVAELAADAGVHPDHLTRSFKAHYGMLIGDFVRALRLEEAARQLARTDRPISRIAHGLGFSDQSHLTRLFKRRYGTTPGRYRAAQPGADPA